MKVRIFYSWQSDTPPTTNRKLIEDAAQIAIDNLKSESEFEVHPSIDRDTLNVPGSPAIAKTILEKIDQSDLIICDVTIVTSKQETRPSPNPNVLIELGYAAARKGWNRIIFVMNECYGGPTKLPFDLRHRRWPIRYSLSEKANTQKAKMVTESLSKDISEAIRTAIDSGAFIKTVNPKDKRIATKFEAILNGFMCTLHMFLKDFGDKADLKIFQNDYYDEPGTNYPPPLLVEPIVSSFENSDFYGASNAKRNDRQLTWAEAFKNLFAEMSKDCERILLQYADRDELLISLIDEMQTRTSNLNSLIRISITQPELKHLYDNGVPEVHIDWYRYLLLTVLKSYRTIREFKDNL